MARLATSKTAQSRLELLSVPYAGQSNIASGQECVNLYCEINAGMDPQAPAKTTYYQTPGTFVYFDPAANRSARLTYRTSSGAAYYVVGPNVYYLYGNIQSKIGTIADLPSRIYASDNGVVFVMVDGQNGYVINLATNQLSTIIDPNFYPADYVALLDTYFIFNRANTNQFFISESVAGYGDLTNSSIATATITNAGSGYVNGTYQNVSLTGGSGVQATAEIVVTGNVVTTCVIANTGYGYLVGDVLSAAASSIGGSGSGFTWTVATTGSAFNSLDIAAKSGFSDPIVGIVTVHRELWLVGQLTTEVWVNTGAADFTFQEVQGAYINHGCAAKYSIAVMDVLCFFLMQDGQGSGLVVMGQGYDVTEISTPRLVKEFKSYSTISDAIGFCFQISDHAFYALVFPTANKGWLYDLTTSNKLNQPHWSEWNYTDINGALNRPRANCAMFFNGVNLVGDWSTGQLLQLDPNTFQDVGQNITCIRTFPHVDDNNVRISTNTFEADMEPGESQISSPNVNTTSDFGSDFGSDFDNTNLNLLDISEKIYLSWSDDKGRTYGNPVGQTLGYKGKYLTTLMWNRLGQARDRVFKIEFSINCKTALNGGFIRITKAKT